MLTEDVNLAAGAALGVDPRARALPNDTQFSVTATGKSGAQIASIVMEINLGDGDGAMAYEAFLPLAADPIATGFTRIIGRLTTNLGAPAANVCVVLGPGGNCITFTGPDGSFAYEVSSSSQVTWTFHYLVNGVEKGSQTQAGPFTASTWNLPSPFALLQ